MKLTSDINDKSSQHQSTKVNTTERQG